MKKNIILFLILIAFLFLGFNFDRITSFINVAKANNKSLLCGRLMDCIPPQSKLPKGVCAPGRSCT